VTFSEPPPDPQPADPQRDDPQHDGGSGMPSWPPSDPSAPPPPEAPPTYEPPQYQPPQYGQAPGSEPPQYQQPPPSYQPPQYGQPQYGQQPGSEQPQYGQPQYGQAPGSEQPQYGQPQYGQQAQYGQQPGYAQPAYPPPSYPGQYPGAEYPGAQYPGTQYPGNQYPGGQFGGQYPGDTGAARPRDGFSIAALVLGIIAIFPLGIIFGIIGITRTKLGIRRGRGMAIAGIILSSLWVALLVVGIVVAVVDATQGISRDANGQISKQQKASPARLRAGDCLNTPDSQGTEINKITVMPCSIPHNAQDIAEVTIPDGSYPGASSLQSTGSNLCLSHYIAYLGTSHTDLEPYLFYPSKQRWNDLDDHKVHCVLVNTDGNVTGQIKDH
jgi:hypothetical protein